MISIRRLSEKETDILTKLFKYNDVNAAMLENKKLISDGIADIFCIFDGTNPFGELRVKYKSDDKRYTVDGTRVYLYAFRINKEYRGQGYGIRLMQSVIDYLELHGYSEFTIGVGDDNKRAKHIYEKLGFDKVIAKETEEYQGDKYSYTLYLKS